MDGLLICLVETQNFAALQVIVDGHIQKKPHGIAQGFLCFSFKDY